MMETELTAQDIVKEALEQYFEGKTISSDPVRTYKECGITEGTPGLVMTLNGLQTMEFHITIVRTK